MAVKVWDLDQSGQLTSVIRRMGLSGMGAETHRTEAEELDRDVDDLLDRAAILLARHDASPAHSEFAKRWAIGRAIAESQILDSPQLEPEETPDLWLAMARKCRLGVRHGGKSTAEPGWRGLIPKRTVEPKRMDVDIFALGMWLQEQELDDARLAFGHRIHNAKQIWSGEALRHLVFKNALTSYFMDFNEEQRELIYPNAQYSALATVLRRRWPSRGKGSAKRPIHYSSSDLLAELHRLLDPIAVVIMEQQQ